MKKRVSVLLSAVVIVSAASCKKDYTCTCNTVTGGVSSVYYSSTINDTKKNAQAACSSHADVPSIVVTCSLQ